MVVFSYIADAALTTSSLQELAKLLKHMGRVRLELCSMVSIMALLTFRRNESCLPNRKFNRHWAPVMSCR